jgi:hypothetical protein
MPGAAQATSPVHASHNFGEPALPPIASAARCGPRTIDSAERSLGGGPPNFSSDHVALQRMPGMRVAARSGASPFGRDVDRR